MTYRRWLTILFAFLLATVALLGAGMVLAVRMIRRPDYAVRLSDPSIVVQEKPFRMFNQRCEVLIDGDSTASTSVDPRVITAETGLSACNIASTRPIFDALDTWPLDTFLEHNPAPKILVLQFGPEIFYRGSDWENIPPFAPYALVLREGTAGSALRLILGHPVASVQVLQLAFKLEYMPRTPEEIARLRGVFARSIATFEQSGGRLNLEASALNACDSKALDLHGPLDTRWIAQLRSRYAARDIVTLVNSSPVPACDPQLGKFRQDLAPYLDADTSSLPIGLFVGGDRHMTAEGARVESTLLAQQIKAVLAQHPSSH